MGTAEALPITRDVPLHTPILCRQLLYNLTASYTSPQASLFLCLRAFSRPGHPAQPADGAAQKCSGFVTPGRNLPPTRDAVDG